MVPYHAKRQVKFHCFTDWAKSIGNKGLAFLVPGGKLEAEGMRE